ncbi:hypothetical protein [Eoetvoesiella caeni]
MTNTAKSPLLLKVAALAAAFSLQGAAMAAAVNEPSPLLIAAAEQTATTQSSDQAAAPRADKSMRGHHRHQHQKAAMMIPGYGGLSEAAVQTLDLNDAQSKLLADAQSAQKEARKSRYESMKAERQARAEQLKAGKIDPHAAVKQADEARGKALEARNQIAAKWFAVWDSLDTAQQQKVATLLGERAAQRGERMKEMKRMHKGSHHSEQTQSDNKTSAS